MNYDNEAQRVIVIDDSRLFVNKFADDNSLYFIFEEKTLDSVKYNYKDFGYSAVLYIPQLDIDHPKGIKFYSENQIGIKTEFFIKKELERVLRKLKMEKAGLNQTLLDYLDTVVGFENIVLNDEGEKSGNAAVSAAFGYLMGIVIYIVLLIYGTLVMRGVMEEKTSRIVEVIISSVRPFQLMMGKIIGIGAVGLTQFFLWTILMFVVNFFFGIFLGDKLSEIQGMNLNASQMQLQDNDVEKMITVLHSLQSMNYPLIIFSFCFYFFGGYILYASLFAAIGSLSNEEGETQSLTFIVTIPIIISVFIMMKAVSEPGSNLAFWASMIPFSSPIVMMARIPFGVPVWQIALSMLCLISGFIFTTWIAAKIYRTGILLYGKKITLKEIGKWVMYKN